jgi:hypothetical protein
MAGAFHLERSTMTTKTKKQLKARAKRRTAARLNRKSLRSLRRDLFVYDGQQMVGHVLTTDDRQFQTYGADGYPAGVFNSLRAAAASLPKAKVESVS